ncbi:universal stress protein [Allokutzneria albata]|uniref:Nucleotide-binding universal stress protein, UspA family n=1 Tax=Allokutzneria albata TaxID=211114 RepID=A0A1G9T661_ALLAB|nr:universal stress protein [Allokutzneria albata]SDM42585.1 Nucleotide-binding universal stress protein, UspA family [Allokutzneria albata]
MASRAVVVGFDDSARARRAVLWATREASSRGCALLIVHVLREPTPQLVYIPITTPLPEIVGEDAVRAHAESELSALVAECERMCPDVDIETSLSFGHPTEVLSQVGADAELVVLGPSGRTGLARALLGSTTAHLVKTSTRPIVVVRDGLTDGGRVVVGVDGSPSSIKAIEFAFEFADRRGGDLIAVHAWSDLPVDALAPVRVWDYDWRQVRSQAEDMIERCLEEPRRAHPDVRVERVVSFEGPAHALLEEARDAALLVVGSHGRGTLRRAFLGSVSHAVLYHAPCTLAVVRVED